VALGILYRAYDEKQVFGLYNQLFNENHAQGFTESSEALSDTGEEPSQLLPLKQERNAVHCPSLKAIF